MLCEKCSSMHFKRSNEQLPSRQASITQGSDEDIYYIHQASFSALQQSKANCHLCRKIWDGLYQLRCQQKADDKFDPCSPVYLIIWFPDKVFSEKVYRPDRSLHHEIIYARCSTLATRLSFAEDIPNAMHAYLERLSCATDDDTTTLSGRNMELACIWLQHCRDNHQPCKQLAKPGLLPLRIIDISNSEKPFLLTGINQLLQYATLSYKWGNTKKYLTTSKNVLLHHESIPLKKLSKTFKEAFKVARALGFSYFWTDALCIQHDVPDEINEQMGRMGEIYSSSTLTIFAAAGNNSDHGLQTERDCTLTKPSAVRIGVTVRDWHYEDYFYISSFESSFPQVGEGSPLTERGWVLQEEALSARGLWFGGNRIAWNCLCESATESSPGVTAVERIDKAKLRSLDPVISSLMGMRYRLREGCHQLEHQKVVSYSGRDIVEDEWYRLVQNFTTRELTYSSDVLPALSGIASKISEIYGIHYVAGLWEEDLQLGLLWQSGPPNSVTESFHNDKTPSALAPQQKANRLGARSIKLNAVQKATREAIHNQNDNWVAVSGLDDDWENVASIGKASFSWISHYLSGKSVTYNHYRKYKLETSLGIQILKVIVKQAPMYKNPFGEILSASLKVRARVKKAILADEDIIFSRSCSYRLINVDDFQFSGKYVAELYPDYPDMVERYNVIHCVLCAVALVQRDSCGKEGKGVLNCIGVVPSSTLGQSNEFVRIGLIKVLDERWFSGCGWGSRDDLTDVQEFELV